MSVSGPPPPVRPDIRIRTATRDDAGRLAQLLAGGAIRAKEDPDNVWPYVDAIDDIVATPGNEIIVATLDDRIVGMCQLIVFRQVQERGGWCAEVESVHVDGEHRSAGIGTTLMAEAIRRAKNRGCFRLQLTSAVSRHDAHRWYRRMGFEPSHTGFKYPLDYGE